MQYKMSVGGLTNGLKSGCLYIIRKVGVCDRSQKEKIQYHWQK